MYMKKVIIRLFLASVIFMSNHALAQEEYIELHLTGILPEIEKRLLPGDVICVLAHTAFDNYSWTELTRTAENINDPIVLSQYSGAEGNIKAPLKGKNITQTVLPPEAKTPPVKNGANVVELKQHRTRPELSTYPDTLSNGLLQATLAKDATVSIGLQQILLQGGLSLIYNLAEGFVSTGIVKGDQSFKTEGGTVFLKGGSRLQLYRFRIKSCKLAQDAILLINRKKFYAKSDINEEGDLQFDEDGQITTLFTAQAFEIKSSKTALQIPAYSRI
jgi:hypothetical protein